MAFFHCVNVSYHILQHTINKHVIDVGVRGKRSVNDVRLLFQLISNDLDEFLERGQVARRFACKRMNEKNSN